MAIQVGFASDLGISSQSIMKFYEEHWPRKISLSDRSFHEWQFVQPVNNDGANCCVVAEDSGQVLGVMGLNKRSFHAADRIMNGAELTTWIVDNKIKGAGIGVKILNYITDNFDYLIGMGITEDALPIYLRSGFRYLRYIPRYIYIIDVDKILNVSEHAFYAKKVISHTEPRESNVHYEQVEWKNVNHIPFVEGHHFSRKQSDLVWRYDNHPYFDYLTFKVYSDNTPEGYVVFRTEITDDIKILHVVDILGVEESYLNTIDFIESYAKKNEFWAVDMFSTYAPLNKYFNMRGWLSAVDSSFVNIPHLYHPLEVRKPATTSLVYWAKDKNIEFFDITQMYLTKQDADLDRPTMDFIKKIL